MCIKGRWRGKEREWIDGRGERGRNRYNVMDFR